MNEKRQPIWGLLITMLIVSMLLGGCLITPPPPLGTPTASATWTTTPEPSATTDWFPATATDTPRVTQTVPPTPTLSLFLGSEVLNDQFDQSAFWPTRSDWNGNAVFGKNSFTLAVTGDKGTLSSIRTQPSFTDFYAEIYVDVSLCRGGDSYGLLLRADGEGYNYRWVINCDGRTRIERLRGGGPLPLTDWVYSGAIRPGAPKTQTLGVWMAGNEMRFYADGTEVFSASDTLYKEGAIGFFARAEGNSPVTVSFFNLHVMNLRVQDIPTKTLIPSATLPPTKTLAPTQ